MSVKHYTPELAREETKKAFNWREYVQGPIDKYVEEAAKELGWDYEPSNRTSLGCLYLIISWEDK